ncbi:LuxR C-terminal-related transcriptional regulator [Kitasatospora sp. NPDC056181]|uniref:LuxR C-terminal-related transcriptional regulator n=1 Tax=Kitasatospora sp. NPDC056181 TaxID=3345737 RepID=UPI0035E1550F
MTPTPTEPVRVFLVEANPLIRIGIGAVLSDGTVDLVGEAADAEACLEQIGETGPHVVLLDLDRPRGSGLAAVRSLVRRFPAVGVVATGSARNEENGLALAALSAGARGFLLKDLEPAMILDAVRLVRGGGVVLSPGVGGMLPSLLASAADVPSGCALAALTAREHDVLGLIACGFDNRRIARELILSDKTVRNYVSAVLTKLGAGNRGEAIVAARTAGLGQASRSGKPIRPASHSVRRAPSWPSLRPV